MRCDSWLLGSVSSARAARVETAGGHRRDARPLRESTGAPVLFVDRGGAAADDRGTAGRGSSLFTVSPLKVLLMKGGPRPARGRHRPQSRRCLIRPSLETTEDAAAANFRGDQDHAAVGAKLGDSSLFGIGEDLHLLAGQVHHGKLEAAVATADEGEALAVGRRARRHVVAALEVMRWTSPPLAPSGRSAGCRRGRR